MFEVGTCVDVLIEPMFNKWSEGWIVVEMPTDFVPLGDCIYVEKDGHCRGVPPPHLRLTLSNNPQID